MQERTNEEKIHILHLYWTGVKTDEDAELMASIPDNEKQIFMQTLSEILKSTVEYKDSGTSIESMYENYEVNLR